MSNCLTFDDLERAFKVILAIKEHISSKIGAAVPLWKMMLK